jgi:hypothetical protein
VAWEPGEKISWRDPMGVVEFTLEARGGKTVVRMVQSLFLSGSDWENEWFESSSYGWGFMLAGLRWWLEVHREEARKVAWPRIKVGLSREAAYRRVTGANVLFTESPAEVLHDGGGYQLHAKTGETFSGVVEFIRAGRGFCVTVRELNDALLWFTIEGTAPNLEVQAWLSAFGITEQQVKEFGERWQQQLRNAFES